MVKDINLASKLMVILLILLKIVVEIQSAPVSAEIDASSMCPTPGTCYFDPEQTCKDHSECTVSSDRYIAFCCPHACKGKKVCIDFRLPKPSTTTRPTIEDVTTTEFKTEPPASKKLSTKDMLTSTHQPTNSITTATDLPTSTIFSTNEPTTIARSTTTEEFASTAKSSTTETHTTQRAKPQPTKYTTELPTEDIETTTTEYVSTKSATTTQTPITTKIPTTTKQPPTTLPPSTTPTTVAATPTTQSTTQEPHVCGRSDAKDILFIIDGTVNYRRYWVTSAREFKQLKHFLKDVISELKGYKFNIGVMQYGGRNEPEMEIDFWEGANTGDLTYPIDNMKQMGGEKRFTGASLAVASNKLYELDSLYERASAQDIIVLITRGRPSDKKQLSAEVDMLKRRKVRLIAIGMGSFPRYLAKTLKEIASSNEDAISSKYSDLTNKKIDLLEKICLPAKLPGTEALCRNKKYDIHFILDGSRSINHLQFDKKRKFLRDVFFLLESPPSDLNIGMLQFSTVEKTEEILNLEKHSLPEELDIIENMEYHSGRRTMLGHALNRVNDEVFNGSGGDRDGIENVLVIFSDGQAHDIDVAYKEADNMKERNVRVIAMSVDENSYIPDALKRLATDPKYALNIKLSNTAYFAKKVVSMICQAEE